MGVSAGNYQIFSGYGSVQGLMFARPEWFGAIGDGVSENSSAISKTFSSVSSYGVVDFIGHAYAFNGVVTVTTSNITVRFNGTTFKIGDTNTAGTISNGAAGKIGFLFKGADHLTITGSVRCIGQGTPGLTSLAGMVFDQCHYAHVTADMYFENMAAGRFVYWCDYGLFGDVVS